MANKCSSAEKPKDLTFDTLVVDVKCHPSKDVLAVGTIEGDVSIHSYSCSEDNHELMSFGHHKKACRAVRFSDDGECLYTASKDKSFAVVDLNSGTVLDRLKKAHESPIYCLLPVDKNIIATGDDDGNLKVWDMRFKKTVMEVRENEEFISDMLVNDAGRLLVATSGDGTLTAFNIRKHKMDMQSELLDSEQLSLAMMKDGTKVVCGSGDGVLNIFNWSEWGNISDRFPGHPLSIDCIVPITENILCTGSMDGVIRAVNILPNRFMGSIGSHGDFPVENMSKSHDSKFLVSCSHDQTVKFWNIEDLPNQSVDASRKAKKTHRNKSLNKSDKNDFFADMLEEGDNAVGGGGEEERAGSGSKSGAGSGDCSDDSDHGNGDSDDDDDSDDDSDD